MRRINLRGILQTFGCFVLTLSAGAQIVTYTWIASGGGTDDNYSNTANWQSGQVPLNDGLARLSFPTANGPEVVTLPSGSLTLNSLYFDASYPGVSYRFGSAGATTLTIAPTAGSAGQNSNNSGSGRTLIFDAGITLNFATDQYWTASSITFNGAAGGAGRFRFMPHSYYSSYYMNTGNLTLNGPGSFTGGFESSNVNLYLNHASALAGGSLFLTDTQIIAGPGYVLNNAMQVSGRFQSLNNTLTLTGPVTLAGVTGMGGNFVVTGNIGELNPGGQLNITHGTVRLSGNNTYTGETVVEGASLARLVFETAASVPTVGLIRAEANAYAGVAFTSGVQSAFINRLNTEQYQGTIGFDSFGATQTFAEDIDLTSQNNPVGLGTTTSAILTGTIWTAGDDTDHYRFGNGGGTLTVASTLDNSAGLEVATNSYWTPTTIVLQGNNSFPGDVNVRSGVVIFDSANALPEVATIHLRQQTGSWDFAYAGFTENTGLTPAALLQQFNALANQSVLGVDSTNPNTPRTLADNIDLTDVLADFSGDTFFIGTATGSTLTGTLDSDGKQLGLTGLKGAQLTVNSTLTDASIGGLVIGLNGINNPDVNGTVRLNGASTFTGGTLWQSGDLILGHSAALGAGKLDIDIDGEGSALTYTGNFTLANAIHFSSSYAIGLGEASSSANLTLTGLITGGNFGGLDYRGAGTLTYAGASPLMGWLEINAAPGGNVVYARPNALAAGTELISGSLSIAADTDIKLLNTSVGTTVQLAAGSTLGLLYNQYSEGPATHQLSGNIAGAGGLRVEDNNAALVGNNSYTGGTTLSYGYIGFTQNSALGTGALTVTSAGGGLTALASDLVLGNGINLQGELRVSGGEYFGYYSYTNVGNRNLTLSGVISGPGSLYKESTNVLTLSGDNTFAGGVEINGGTVVFAHDHAAGAGPLSFDSNSAGGTATFTTGAPVIGGLEANSGYATVNVQLAAGSTLTINQARDSVFFGGITGSGAQLAKTGAGYLTLSGSVPYGYTGGTTITGGGMIFDSDSLIDSHAGGGITVATGAYAGLGGQTARNWTTFLAKINPASQGTLGVDGNRYVEDPVDLSGFSPALRLGSASFGTLADSAVITPNGDYRFGGGGGTLELWSTLTADDRGLDLTSPAAQPLTLWLRNNNYFGGPMNVTHSAAVFGPHSAEYLTNIAIGPGGYVGSADPQLVPADFLAKIAPGTNTGMVGFDTFNYTGRSVGGLVDLSAFGDGLFLGTATTATLQGPLVLPTGSTTYRFGAYKGGSLTVETSLGGTNSVVIGDLGSFGTMRHPHQEDTYSSVTLTGLNTHTGGTVLNAGALRAGSWSLGTGALTVQPNSFVSPENTRNSLPRFEPIGLGDTIANPITLNGSLWLGGIVQTALSGVISGVGGLHVERYDYQPLILTGANTYTGGTVMASGNLGLGHDAALGTGAVTMHTNGGLVTQGGPRTLANAFSTVVAPDSTQQYFRVAGPHDLTLNGPIAFAPGSVYFSDINSLPTLPQLRLNGGLSGDTSVYFQNDGRVWLAGTNTYTGGTEVQNGELIFDSVASIPALGQLTNYTSYIGLATPTATLQTDYINRFSAGYGRSIGFDSPNPAAPQTFAANINLTGWDHPYLSSATAAILTGTITPSDNYYRFAATGGGILTVASNLTGGRDVQVDYDEAPLLLRLSGTNSYTGQTRVNGAGVIFATAASLPAGSMNFSPNENTGSYFGYEDPAISVASFLTHFDPAYSYAMVGFDSVDVEAPRTITSPDLSYFTQNPTDVYIATATRAIIAGTITWPTFNYGANFAAYRTGWLTVNALLSGANVVRIGDEDHAWSLRAFEGGFPTVELAGNNTYTGDTEFHGGQLMVSHANALGTGTLFVRNPSFDDSRTHRLLLNTPAVANNVFFENYTTNFRVATTQSVATLSGVVSGYSDLTKEGANTVRLTGANSFGGNITIEQGILEFAHQSASGDVSNPLRFTKDGGIARFTTGNPVIRALLSDDLSPATVELGAGVGLTVGNHDEGYSYEYYDYYGSITGTGNLTKDGHGTLVLHGASSYTGGTTITQGTLLADHSSALGTGAIILNGGELTLGQGVTIFNSVGFGGSGGKLSGDTTFTGAVVLGTQAGLSPGNSPGTMTFGADLTLGGASFLDFEIQDPTGLAGTGYDTVVVGGTLFITATPATPFVINLLSLTGQGDSGQLELSNPNATYSLLVVSAGAISGFAPENFTLNTAGFSTNFGNDFSFELLQSGNELRLNFAPVPEPSTYALLGLGGLLAGLARWRTRFNRRA